MNETTDDDDKIKEVVQANRQRLSVAKAELEEALEKQFSQKTLERYIKNVLVVKEPLAGRIMPLSSS